MNEEDAALDKIQPAIQKLMKKTICLHQITPRFQEIEDDKLHDTKVTEKHIALHSALSQLASDFDRGEYDVLAEIFIVDRMLVYADDLLQQTQGALSFTLQFKLIQEKTNADHIRKSSEGSNADSEEEIEVYGINRDYEYMIGPARTYYLIRKLLKENPTQNTRKPLHECFEEAGSPVTEHAFNAGRLGGMKHSFCNPSNRLDHNLEDVRAKIFPYKQTRVKAPEAVPTALSSRRKERSLSSLVVGTPRVSTQTNMTGKRSRLASRKKSCGSTFFVENVSRKSKTPWNMAKKVRVHMRLHIGSITI
nr:E3 ubiquitin-protein ligase DRIP2-like [Tanacetum cinerariifolium]